MTGVMTWKAISKFKDLTPPRFSDVVSRQDDVSEEWSQVGFSSGLTLQVLRTRESPDGCEGRSTTTSWICRKKPSSR